MCSQCENCGHSCFSRGAVRGVMDCDPDEYWCDASDDGYYYMEDEEIIAELKSDRIHELVSEGLSEEEAEKIADEEEFEVDCPSYSYCDPYDEGPDPDAWYDRMKDEGLL